MADPKTKELEDRLFEVGRKLASPPSDPTELLSLLDQTENILSRVEQSPSQSMFFALQPSMEALITEQLLQISEVEIKVALASCISEITRITAPRAPYADHLMKDIFRVIVDSFEKLDDISSHSYSKRVSILETAASIRSCVVMLDLECHDLILKLFQLFLKITRPDHGRNVFSFMENIMTLVLEESEHISTELLSCLLLSVKEDNKDDLAVARRLGEKVIGNCAVKIKPYLAEQLQSMGASFSDFSSVVAYIFEGKSIKPVQNELQASGECVICEAQTRVDEPDKILVKSRILVWWPDDARFYAGTVDSYDPVTKKHTIFYDDGDIERLSLKNERWKFFTDFDVTDPQGQGEDIPSPNIPSRKGDEVANSTVEKISEWLSRKSLTNLSKKRPFAGNMTGTEFADPKIATGVKIDSKRAKTSENSNNSSQENEMTVKDEIPGGFCISNSPVLFQDHTSALKQPGWPEVSKGEVPKVFCLTFNDSETPDKTTDERPMDIDEIEDLKTTEAKKRQQREERRKQVSLMRLALPAPLPQRASSPDEVHVEFSEHIFDSDFLKKIRVFSQIIRSKWYQINPEPLINYAELADEFGRSAAFDHGNLFNTIRQNPHYQGTDASETEVLEDLWYELPLIFEGLHKSLESQIYFQKNAETISGWINKLDRAGFDISVPLAAFHLLTSSPVTFKKFWESVRSISSQLVEEEKNVDALKSKLPVSKRVAEIDSKIEALKKQVQDLELERVSMEGLKGAELELEKYGTSLKARRLGKLKELYEKEIADAENFLREVSLDSFFKYIEHQLD